MKEFLYSTASTRVTFGPGTTRHLQRELSMLQSKRALVISTSNQAELAVQITDLIGSNTAGLFLRAAMHVPAQIVSDGIEHARARKADSLIAVGGGSAIGMAKAMALILGLPIIAIPTTYSGSEMTPIYGITDNGVKKTGRDLVVLPKAVIYDAELTLQLPLEMTVTSAINAIAHAAEGLYGQESNPIMENFSEEGIQALAQAIPALCRNPEDVETRSKALYGAWMCGSVLGNVGMALHHKICHTLGGTLNLPHSELHTVMLPYVLRFNSEAAPSAMTRIAKALGADDAAVGCHALASEHGAATTLSALGMSRNDIDKVVALAMRNPYWNPRPITEQSLRKLLTDAYEGVLTGT